MNTTSIYLAIVCFASLAACGSDKSTSATTTTTTTSTSTPTSHAVKIANYAFSPASLSVAVGDSVAFTNADLQTHDMAVKAGEGFTADSGAIAANATQSITFAKAGTYQLYCTIHPSMTLTITVK